MSDILEKCMCGGIRSLIHPLDKYQVLCFSCECHSPKMETKHEAITTWNSMQQSLKSGWISEVPTEEGHYLFIGSYEDRFDNPVILAKPMYARLSMAYTDATGKKPDGVVATVDGFTGWPHQFNGLWFRINFPDPPKE